ncbi:(2Fe-2S) ferredoxin domain-containing protein [Actinocorallia longicatena]|uniref:(2Fe-2S) ferredoxin domain-containing protein n=1 Tax=Actinocorallia longicatena TaxID=111803 RepID=A0ABP6Q0U7_9ACTN
MTPRLVVCRGCCCGSEQKSPQVDHAGLLARLRGIDGVAVRTSECLGPCSQANVVVVRRPGERPVWLALMNSAAAVGDLEEWLSRGGPLPDTLELLHRIPAYGPSR